MTRRWTKAIEERYRDLVLPGQIDIVELLPEPSEWMPTDVTIHSDEERPSSEWLSTDVTIHSGEDGPEQGRAGEGPDLAGNKG